jgi:hypothetical protein
VSCYSEAIKPGLKSLIGESVSSFHVCAGISSVLSYFLFLRFPLKMSKYAVLAGILLTAVALEEELKICKIR